MTDRIAWVGCQEVGCDAGLAVDARHLSNFEGRWCCPDHERNRP